MYIVP
jgi:hypothetical protein